jgi:hypothetical protein
LLTLRAENGLQLATPRTDSSDIAPSDFFAFRDFNDFLDETTFSYDGEPLAVITGVVNEIRRDFTSHFRRLDGDTGRGVSEQW